MVRAALAASIFACAFLAPGTTVAAGAVLPPNERPDPAFVDMRMAVAVSPTGTTRWSEITVPAATPVMWLVPARPGAAIDWAPRRWLDAIDDATAPRVLPPDSSSSCVSRRAPDGPITWTTPRPQQPGAAIAVQATADGARAYVAERGYQLSPALDGKISSLYANGWNLVALEMESSPSQVSSGTLRVSDDGGPVLPLALSGGSSTRLTVFTIGPGIATIPGARDVSRQSLRWGMGGSSFTEWRKALIVAGGGDTWLRESSSHAVLFDGMPVAGGTPITSVVASYFQGTSCSPSTAQSLGSDTGFVGTTCAPGAAARVPGGASCINASGNIDPAPLACAADIDLALALAGLVPARAAVTRFVGWFPAGVLGTDLALGFDPATTQRPPAFRAGAYEECPPATSDLYPPDPPSSSQPPLSSSSSAGSGDVYVPTSDGCSGGTAVATGTTYEEEPPSEDSSSESCSGDGSSGWDESDTSDGWDDSDSGDSCSSDEPSSSSDSCSGGSSSSSSGGSDDGWDSEDSDDGWDTEDDMSPTGKKLRPATKKPKPHAKTTKKKSSPVSRYALLAAALLLPLRRKRRGPEAG